MGETVKADQILSLYRRKTRDCRLHEQ